MVRISIARSAWRLAALAFVAVSATGAAAQETTIKRGDSLYYSDDRGSSWARTYVGLENGGQVFDSGSGRVVFHQTGSAIQTITASFSPYSGMMMTPHHVGKRWTHWFTRTSSRGPVKRIRNCEVENQETKTVGGATFENVFVIECTNQRVDRPLPKHEEIWFAPSLGREIRYKSWWDGGGYSYELDKYDPAK